MKHLLLIASFLVFSIACNQPDNVPDTRQTYLVKHTWKYTSKSINGSQQILDACFVDDIWSFSPNGDVLINYGDVRCSSSQTPSLSGTYQLSPDQQSLYIAPLGTTYFVNNIDEYTLDITEAIGFDSIRYVLNAR
jgi:hypothetical protein